MSGTITIIDGQEVHCHANNPKLKTVNQKMAFSEFQILEMKKCEESLVYFAMNYCKIVHIDRGLINFEPYDFQKKMLHHMQENRFSILKTGRQQGKTTCSAIFLLWFTLFNERKVVGLLANKGDLAQEILLKYQDLYQELPMWLQQGIISWNKRSIELENKSRIIATSTSGTAARGFAFSLLYIDELAFVSHNVWEEFYTSVYPTVSSGKESRIILTSTPNGLNHFWQMWNKSIEGTSLYSPFSAIWSDVPWRDEKWKEEQIQNTSLQQFNQEHEASFLGSSATLISPAALESMKIMDPIYNREDGTKIYYKPIPEHKYVMTVDTSRGYKQDYSVFTVFDVTKEPYNVAATFRQNTVDPLYFSHFVNFYGRAYNYAHVLCELNDAGGQVADNLYHEHEYENIFHTITDKATSSQKLTLKSKGAKRGVMTSRSVKARGCTILKSLVEGSLLVVNDEEIQSEAMHFVRVKQSFKAESGYHDDLMMTLVLFAWLSTQHEFGSLVEERTFLHYKKGESLADEYDNTPVMMSSTDLDITDDWALDNGGEISNYYDLYRT